MRIVLTSLSEDQHFTMHTGLCGNTNNILVTYGALQVLYCIVLYCKSYCKSSTRKRTKGINDYARCSRAGHRS